MPETNSSSSTVVPVTSTSGVSGLESQVDYWRSIAEELRETVLVDIGSGSPLQDYNFTDDTYDFIL